MYSDGDLAVAIQASATSVRFQAVTTEYASEHEYAYRIAGGHPVLRDDGGVDIVEHLNLEGVSASTITASVDAPWARDANGEELDTHFAVTGDSIVQVVNATEEAAYPIVADPHIDISTNRTILWLNRPEMAGIRNYSALLATLVMSPTCAYYGSKLAKIPGLKLAIEWVCGHFTPAAAYLTLKSVWKESNQMYYSGGYPCWGFKIGTSITYRTGQTSYTCNPPTMAWSWRVT